MIRSSQSQIITWMSMVAFSWCSYWKSLKKIVHSSHTIGDWLVIWWLVKWWPLNSGGSHLSFRDMVSGRKLVDNRRQYMTLVFPFVLFSYKKI